MILESIVTTADPQGHVNIAPMGPIVEESDSPDWSRFVLRPFETSTTFRNLRSGGNAVVHVTDDVMLFARAAVETISPLEAQRRLVHRLDDSSFWILNDCCRWFAVQAESLDASQPRAEFVCAVTRTETVRPFFGFNRAKHAVIEAAILATRTHLISADSLREQFGRLRPLIDKTGGSIERQAFELLERTVHDRIQRS